MGWDTENYFLTNVLEAGRNLQNLNQFGHLSLNGVGGTLCTNYTEYELCTCSVNGPKQPTGRPSAAKLVQLSPGNFGRPWGPQGRRPDPSRSSPLNMIVLPPKNLVGIDYDLCLGYKLAISQYVILLDPKRSNPIRFRYKNNCIT